MRRRKTHRAAERARGGRDLVAHSEGTLKELEAQEKAWRKAHDAQKATLDEMTIFADQAARNMQSAFANFLFDRSTPACAGCSRASSTSFAA